MQTDTGRWKLGLAFALTTAVLWGVLPIALKLALEGMDAFTITWYRFAVAAVVLGSILAATGRLPALRPFDRHIGWRLALALGALAGNYVFYLLSLHHTTPAVAQVVIQLGPMFLLLGGLIIFRERFLARQWAGFGLLIVGLAFFFNRRLPQLLDVSQGTGLGVLLLLIAALVWAAYALAQKDLLQRFRPQQILLIVYVCAVVLLLPAAEPGSVRDLTALQAWMLAFSCANTLLAYGAFAEALAHWEVSRVSAVIALAPLFTLAAMWLVNRLAPGLLPEEGLNTLSVLGALMVIAGSGLCALSSARLARRRAPVQAKGLNGAD